MTTITLTDYDIPLNRFDQPLLGVASDALHLAVIWPACKVGFIEKLDPDKIKWSEGFKREMLRKQGGRCPWTNCNDPLDLNDKLEVDHVWPISKGGRNWILNLQLLHKRCNIEKSDRIDFAVNNISPLLPHLVVLIRWLSKHPRVAALIVGGIALVIAIAIVVKWLSEYVNGVRRYLHLLRSAQESLSRLTRRHSVTVSGQLEGAYGFAQKARGIAGGVPTCAVHLADRARGLPSARATKAVNHAKQTVRGAAGVVRRTASGAVNSVPHTPRMAQRAAGRVSDALPRPWRKTRPAVAVSTFGALSRVPVLRP